MTDPAVGPPFNSRAEPWPCPVTMSVCRECGAECERLRPSAVEPPFDSDPCDEVAALIREWETDGDDVADWP